MKTFNQHRKSDANRRDMLDQTTYYFAFGMNTPRDRFEGHKLVGPAVLPAHRLTFHTHADIAPVNGVIVRGTLWKIDLYDLEGLDMQEGWPSYYEREIVQVYRGHRQQGRPVPAITYKMNPNGKKHMNHTPPSRYYVDIIRRGYLDVGHDTKHLYRALDVSNRHHKKWLKKQRQQEIKYRQRHVDNWLTVDPEFDAPFEWDEPVNKFGLE